MEVGEDYTVEEIMEVGGEDYTVEEIVEVGGEEITPNQQQPLRLPASRTKIIMVASIAAAIQFGWALRISLMTPYVQFLGIPHKLASLIWLWGPISSMILEQLVGHYSDRCNSRFGRCSPFIVVGTSLIILAFILIGFAMDIGCFLGDSPCQHFLLECLSSFLESSVVIFLCAWKLDSNLVEETNALVSFSFQRNPHSFSR